MRLRPRLRLRLRAVKFKVKVQSDKSSKSSKSRSEVEVEFEFEVEVKFKDSDKDGSDDPVHHSSTYQRLPKSSKISVGDKTWTGPHGFISNPQGNGETKELAWREVQGRGGRVK